MEGNDGEEMEGDGEEMRGGEEMEGGMGWFQRWGSG